jgi:type II secretory ATPase GspE/PulE/Tfp pilus assembly ATPase PilB-like protein
MQENDIRCLMEDGLVKVVKGLTTIDEVARVCG